MRPFSTIADRHADHRALLASAAAAGVERGIIDVLARRRRQRGKTDMRIRGWSAAAGFGRLRRAHGQRSRRQQRERTQTRSYAAFPSALLPSPNAAVTAQAQSLNASRCCGEATCLTTNATLALAARLA